MELVLSKDVTELVLLDTESVVSTDATESMPSKDDAALINRNISLKQEKRKKHAQASKVVFSSPGILIEHLQMCAYEASHSFRLSRHAAARSNFSEDPCTFEASLPENCVQPCSIEAFVL